MVARLKGSSSRGPNAWGVAKTIKPDQRGAIKLTRRYGNALVCVRYRENAEGDERITTIELIVERAIIQKRVDEIVSFKIKPDEVDLQQTALAKGARFDAKNKMWKLVRREVLRMGLRHRIAITPTQLLQEQNASR